MTIHQALQSALASQQSGDLACAEKIYREILQQHPSQPDALHLLGLLAHQAGQLDVAIDLVRRAIAADPTSADYRYNLAEFLGKKGSMREAVEMYQQALRLRPDFPEALGGLGVALCRLGMLAEASAALKQALKLKPDYGEVHNNLGLALRDQGMIDDAISHFRRALEINPDNAEAHNNLGISLRGKEQVDEAIASLRRAVALRTDFAQAHANLANVLRDKKELDESIAESRKAIALQPDFAEAFNNLGSALCDKGLLDESLAALARAVALKPDAADIHFNIGYALNEARRLEESIAAYVRSFTLRPNHPETYFNLANVLSEAGKLDESAEAFRRAIALRPNYAEAHINLGVLLRKCGKLDESIACYRSALSSGSDFPQTHMNLGVSLCEIGLHEESYASLRHALELGPDVPEALSNLIFLLHYQNHPEARTRTGEFAHRHAEPLRKLIPTHDNDRDPNRRLRIGFVSSDLRAHPVGTFLMPLLAEHDKNQVESFCYASVPRPDPITDRLRSLADHWRDIYRVSDTAAVEIIQRDKIDILIDLAGHTSGNRLLIFARKPAPVQASWLGYPDLTGLDTIDYRITDVLADPPREDEPDGPEKLLRLPDTAWCFRPPLDLPLPNRPTEPGPITFGSYNNFSKVTEEMLLRWAEILRAVEGSRLLISAKALDSPSVSPRIRRIMESAGVTPDRLILQGWEKNFTKHLASYGQTDIVLDTFPYHGTTITCEAMWMGVPVITQAGQTHVSRVGVSLLSNVGIQEFIAQSPEEYVRKAIELANDRPRLAELHQNLRHRMEQSPLMDGPRFARNMEAVYWKMWEEMINAK